MALSDIHLIASFVLGFAGYGLTREYCMISETKSYYYWYSNYNNGIKYRLEYRTKQCYDSCCGYGSSYQYCCYKSTYYPDYESLSIGPIIGIIVGCLIAAGLFIALIICCCISASRNRAMPGRVLQNRQNVAVINTSPAVQTSTYHHHTGTNVVYSSHSSGLDNTAYSYAPPSYDTVVHTSHGGSHDWGGGYTSGGCDIGGGGGGFSSGGGGCDSGGGGGCDSGGGGGCDSGGGGCD